MALVTPAELAANLGVGTLYSDPTLQEICNAADAVLLPMLWNNDAFNVAHSADDDQRTLYFEENVIDKFYVGQAIVVSNNDDLFDGIYSINTVGTYSITYTHEETGRARPYHLVIPYGTVAAQDSTDYSTDSAIQIAALMIASDIFQAKQAPAGGVSIDGFTPQPWKMSAALLAKVRGLIAHALAPGSMVG